MPLKTKNLIFIEEGIRISQLLKRKTPICRRGYFETTKNNTGDAPMISAYHYRKEKINYKSFSFFCITFFLGGLHNFFMEANNV